MPTTFRIVPRSSSSTRRCHPSSASGSGPAGFEASFKQDVRNGLGIKVDVSDYSDTFPPGPAVYCQPDSSTAGIACGTGLTFQATGRALYATAGPEWKIRRGKRFAPFAQTLVGIVYTRSTLMMSGSDVQYTNPFTGGVLLFTSAGFPQDRSIHYADAHADAGLALAIGGGFDIRLSNRLGVRVVMDYDPMFPARPVVPVLTPDAQGRFPSTRVERETSPGSCSPEHRNGVAHSMSSSEVVRGYTTRPNKIAESDRSRLGDVSQNRR